MNGAAYGLTVIGQLAGLVSGANFADFGDQVECVDLDDKGIDALKGSEMPKRHLLFCTWDGL
ncbi:MAG: hypothetical protein E5W98_10280 [Mesorhizobium sp.]|nr:MAG: hypothetical protein E5W98_10280 [Mesorhizobium sp.]